MSRIFPKISVLALCLWPMAVPAWDMGAFLAGRQASADHQFGLASTYFERVLAQDADHIDSLNGLLGAYIGAARIDAALPIADRLVDLGVDSHAANLTRVTIALRDQNWQTVLDHLEADHSVGIMVDEISAAWASQALGDVPGAVEHLDKISTQRGVEAAALFHKAMILAKAGEAQQAEDILSKAGDGPLPISVDVLIARVQVLSQLDRHSDALQLIETYPDPRMTALRRPIEAGAPVPFDVMTTPAEAMSDLFLTLADVLSEQQPDAALIYARMAQTVLPDNPQAALMAADFLAQLERHDLAIDAIGLIPDGVPLRNAADQLLAEQHEAMGDVDAAIATLERLVAQNPDAPFIVVALGDMQARHQDNEGANASYTTALDLMPADQPGRWIVLYTRAIAREQLDLWPQAEADFRAALKLEPNQPNVLNYLGYSLLERSGDAEEALEMITRAVDAEPHNGAIVDSLAWAYYRLGRFPEAVTPMERASELEPVDPIITDHWGDVLWAVGRKQEAVFQWKRALSFEPEDDLRARILRKLDQGLDAVLISEGKDPTTK